jgi:hypothetical protein
VLVLEDNDEPGRRKSKKTAEALHGVAQSVRIVSLPGLGEGEDVSDWLAAGNNHNRLREIAIAAPIWGQASEAPSSSSAPIISATQFRWIDPRDIEPREFIYGWHFARQYIATTIAVGGIGKSSLLIVEALAIGTGKPLLGITPRERVNVWIWNGEDPARRWTAGSWPPRCNTIWRPPIWPAAFLSTAAGSCRSALQCRPRAARCSTPLTSTP